MRTFVLFGITLLISCASKKDFNIVSDAINIDTLEMRLRYDSFETQIKKNLLTKVDTTDYSKALGALTDTSIMKNWNRQSANLGIEYFQEIFDELTKPNGIRNVQEEVIHFTILNKDYLELEISKDVLLFTRNRGDVISKTISEKLWRQARNECKCNKTDNINHILVSFQGNNIYRLDLNLDNKYQFCWKTLSNSDVLNQFLKEIEK